MKKKQEFEDLKPLSEDSQKSNPPEPMADETPTKKPGLLYYLFSPETRLGRFMRPLVRTIAIIVTLFAVGFFSAYFMIYQPRLAEMNQAKADLKAVTLKLNQTEGTLAAAQKYLSEATAKYEMVQTDLATEKNHTALLGLLAEVNEARSALARKDGAAARLNLKNSRDLLEAYLPIVQAHSAEMAQTFDTRMNLVQSEFSRDPETALADLDLLAGGLKNLEKELYK
jgi:hypothetical protein